MMFEYTINTITSPLFGGLHISMPKKAGDIVLDA
jgi:hypothetical protein